MRAELSNEEVAPGRSRWSWRHRFWWCVGFALCAGAPGRMVAADVVVDFEQAETGTWISSWEEQGVTFALAWSPTKTKAPGRVTVFPHLGTQRRGLLCAMADEPIPVQATFPSLVSAVTISFWASIGCAARLEAFNTAGEPVDQAELAAAPARAAPGDPMPFFELTVRGRDIAYVRFSGPRSGEFLAADTVRFTPQEPGGDDS